MAIDDIAVAAQILDNRDDPHTYITYRGVKLQLSPVNSVLVQEAARRIPLPRPPMWLNPDKDREEENPNDPEYIDKREEVMFERGLVAVNLLLTGTKPIHIPEDVQKPEDDDWIFVVEQVAGIKDVPDRGVGRYIAWLKYYVCTDDDLLRLRNKIGRLSGGTLEVDVQDAQDSFRTDEGRQPNNGDATSSDD